MLELTTAERRLLASTVNVFIRPKSHCNFGRYGGKANLENIDRFNVRLIKSAIVVKLYNSHLVNDTTTKALQTIWDKLPNYNAPCTLLGMCFK